MFGRRGVAIVWTITMAAFTPCIAGAQSTQIDSAIVVTPSFTGDGFVPKDARIDLKLSRAPSAADGTIAVMIGTEDRTSLFEQQGNQLAYRGATLPLPSGASDVSVYLVKNDA